MSERDELSALGAELSLGLASLLRETSTLEPLAPPLTPHAIERIAAYGALLLVRNRRLNLTGAKSVEALLPHLLDSLSVLPYLAEPFVDIGSGGGLPAIPLAVASGASVVMIEATAKKVAFLHEACAIAGVAGVALAGRAERVAFDEAHRERYALATARAVAVTPTVLEFTLPFVAIGGRVVLQRGAFDERERAASSDAALVLGGEFVEERALEGQRRLLIIEKRRTTPLRFPRRVGVPVKRPLCLT